MSCLFDLSEGHILFPIRKNKIDNSSGSCGTTFPCTGKASVRREHPHADRRGRRSLRCLTGALFSRPFALKARGKVVEGSFDKPGKG